MTESASETTAEATEANGKPQSAAEKVALDRAFEQLYRDHLRDVYSYCYYRIGNHHDAEDLTEQTFLQAYRHFERAQRESDGRPLRPWLIRIAHNLAANYHRDRSRKPTAALEHVEPVQHPHGTERVVEGRERMREVMAGLETLSDDRREALIMRFSLGMSNREIARALGKTDGATKVLIHRSIKQLQEQLDAEGAMMTDRPEPIDLEGILADALRPIEPPERLGSRVESTLRGITDAAAGELSWFADELSDSEREALRDPRNWVRPIAAAAAGTVAGTALVVIEVRRRRRGEGLRGVGREIRARF